MRIALIQQRAASDLVDNLARGLAATRRAAFEGARLVAFSELGLTPFYPARPSQGGPPLTLAESVPGPTTKAFASPVSRAKLLNTRSRCACEARAPSNRNSRYSPEANWRACSAI